MKQFKVDIIEAMSEKSKSYREISLYDTARELGINHISRQDCVDILMSFCKQNTSYKPVYKTDHSDSLFVGGYVTELEYENT